MHRDARFEALYRAHAPDVLGYCAPDTPSVTTVLEVSADDADGAIQATGRWR